MSSSSPCLPVALDGSLVLVPVLLVPVLFVSVLLVSVLLVPVLLVPVVFEECCLVAVVYFAK
jgi:hypothetical protein